MSSERPLCHLKLSNSGGTLSTEIDHAKEKDIHKGFTKAEVLHGPEPGTFWIIYQDTDYSKDTLTPGVKVDDKHDMGVDIRSAQGFNNTDPSIVVFQHFNYSGFGVQYYQTSNLSEDTFPTGNTGEQNGASSFYVVGGTWQFYNANGDKIGKSYTKGYGFFADTVNNTATRVVLVDDE